MVRSEWCVNRQMLYMIDVKIFHVSRFTIDHSRLSFHISLFTFLFSPLNIHFYVSSSTIPYV